MINGDDDMLPVIGFLAAIIVLLAVVDYYNTKRKEAKGICPTSGGTCTSPTGCTCGDGIENHEH